MQKYYKTTKKQVCLQNLTTATLHFSFFATFAHAHFHLQGYLHKGKYVQQTFKTILSAKTSGRTKLSCETI